MTRGRTAEAPTEIPAKGWKDIALRVKDKIGSDHVTLIAAGVAFYALLAIFPAITALMALAGFVLEPSQVTAQIETLSNMIPREAAQIILDQAIGIAGSESAGLGIAFILGAGVALYSASKGMASLMEGLNIVYDESETRGFFKRLATTLVLTLFLILGLILGLVATLAVPVILNMLTVSGWLASVLSLSRWVILALLAMTGLAVLYRYGPARENAQWRWITPGAVAGCLLWIAGSVGFSVYVSNFGSYNETFGSMAGVIILLVWLWISAFIVLLGAELNAEIEAQTKHDSTTGESEPIGDRGAQKADVLGEASN